MEEDRSQFEILTGKIIEKKPLGRPRPSLEDRIRIGVKEIGMDTRN